MALQSLQANEQTGPASPLAPKQPMIPAKAKRVTYLHMAGSPSQLESFEHKPELNKLHMQDCPKSFLEFFFSSRRRHTRCGRDWSSDVCSSDLPHREWSGYHIYDREKQLHVA